MLPPSMDDREPTCELRSVVFMGAPQEKWFGSPYVQAGGSDGTRLDEHLRDQVYSSFVQLPPNPTQTHPQVHEVPLKSQQKYSP